MSLFKNFLLILKLHFLYCPELPFSRRPELSLSCHPELPLPVTLNCLFPVILSRLCEGSRLVTLPETPKAIATAIKGKEMASQ